MKYLLLFFCLVLSVSCSKKLKYFTEDLYEEYDWTDADLRRIQFYVSQDIVLYRNKNDNNTKIRKGQIRVESESDVDRVVIKKGTPGVFVNSPRASHFAIAFDDDRDHFLMFGPNSKAEGRFLLMAKNWDKRKGEISYGKKLYETTSESAYAALMVDIKGANKTNVKSKTAGGRRVRD